MSPEQPLSRFTAHPQLPCNLLPCPPFWSLAQFRYLIWRYMQPRASRFTSYRVRHISPFPTVERSGPSGIYLSPGSRTPDSMPSPSGDRSDGLRSRRTCPLSALPVPSGPAGYPCGRCRLRTGVSGPQTWVSTQPHPTAASTHTTAQPFPT